MKLFKSRLAIIKRMTSKSPLAWVALISIIIGSVSFSNHPIVGYTILGIGFLLGAYVDFFAKKKKEESQ